MKAILVKLASVLMFAITFFVMPNNASAAKWESGLFGISVELPGRWSVDNSRNRSFFSWVNFGDERRDASIFLKAVPSNKRKYGDIQSWMEKNEIPQQLNRYSYGYTYRTSSKKSWMTSLTSGQPVWVLKYDLDFEGGRRNVYFIYFANPEKTRWYYAFVYNQGSYSNQENSLITIIKGITLN